LLLKVFRTISKASNRPLGSITYGHPLGCSRAVFGIPRSHKTANVPIVSKTRWVKRPGQRAGRLSHAQAILAAVPILVLALGVFVVIVRPESRPAPLSNPNSASLQQMAHRAGVSAFDTKAAKRGRLVYPYSVVPGGVRDVGELSQAIAHDPEVAFHYAKFNFRRAHVVQLTADQRMYISYRRHGRILWTKTALLIRAGEKVITDGKVTARTRCGNQLASKPAGLTAPDEPSEAQLNQPVAMAGDPAGPPILLAQKSALTQPAAESGPANLAPGGIPLVVGPILGGGGGSSCETAQQEGHENDHDKNEQICPTTPVKPPHKPPHRPPPVPVPEPGTYLLLGSGVLVLAYRLWGSRSKRGVHES
jgi:PEP-CTERM motif